MSSNLKQFVDKHFWFKRNTPNKRELTLFYQQLATLISAGIPLLTSIQMMQSMQASPVIQHFLSHLYHKLLSGQPLSHSLQTYASHHHATLAHQLIYVGEHIGRLDHCLQMIAAINQSELHYQQQIKQALLYPVILCTTALLMTLCLLILIVPRFAILFAEHQTQLPLLTRGIFFIATIIHDHYLLALFPFFYIAFIFLPLPYTVPSRLSIQQSLLTLPFLAALQKKMNLARFCSQLSLLYQAGIPLTEAIDLMISTTAVNNHRDAMQQLQMQLLAGKSLYIAMRTTSYFSPPLPDMIQVGELSGNLDAMLKHTALLYEGEIERRLKQISQLLEPLIMIILGVLIGGLVIGMYLPIFKLGSII